MGPALLSVMQEDMQISCGNNPLYFLNRHTVKTLTLSGACLTREPPSRCFWTRSALCVSLPARHKQQKWVPYEQPLETDTVMRPVTWMRSKIKSDGAGRWDHLESYILHYIHTVVLNAIVSQQIRGFCTLSAADNLVQGLSALLS